jgi:hypothetical protein
VARNDEGRPDDEGHGLRRKHIGDVRAWLAERF